MTDPRRCAGCGKSLPKGSGPRRIFCGDACRKRAQRAGAVVSPTPRQGAVTEAVMAALEDIDLEVVDRARAALALALARLVDGGSVQAAAQLRGVLNDFDVEQPDLEHLAFRLSVQTPRGRNWVDDDG